MSRFVAVLVAFCALVVASRVVIRQNGTVENLTPESCAAVDLRVDCGFLDITSQECGARGCCWDPQNVTGKPMCFYNANGTKVRKVHLILSNHFDAGYTALANDVVGEYFKEYFPRAASLGAELSSNSTAFSYLTQSYLVSLYLDCPPGLSIPCPSESEREAFAKAVQAGYVTWHAFPHNADLASLSPSMLEFGVRMTHDLDQRYGVRPKTVLSQRDVPGFPIAAVSPLRQAGIRALSEGSNAAMMPPAVPPGFVWRDPIDGSNVTVFWHALGYGMLPDPSDPYFNITKSIEDEDEEDTSKNYFEEEDDEEEKKETPKKYFEEEGDEDDTSKKNSGSRRRLHDVSGGGEEWTSDWLQIPGFDEVLMYGWRSDNDGPPESVSEVRSMMHVAQSFFPGAEVVISDLETFVDAMEAVGAQDALPIVESDIGDTWVMGIPSDPVKTMQVRAVERVRQTCMDSGAAECALPSGASPTSSAFYNFSRLLIKASEHTWGSTGGVMGADRTTNFSNAIFYEQVARGDSSVTAGPESWHQQMDWAVNAPIDALAASSELRENITRELSALEAQWPDTRSLTPVANLSEVLDVGGGVQIQFDPTDMALEMLFFAGKNWASNTHQVGLYHYQTQSQDDIQRFITAYAYALNSQSWLNVTYGKQNAEFFGATHRDVFPTMDALYLDVSNHRVLVHGTLPATVHALAGSPTDVWSTFTFTTSASDQLQIEWDLELFNKTGTRLPEAMFAVFNPAPGTDDPLAAARDRPDLLNHARLHHPYFNPPSSFHFSHFSHSSYHHHDNSFSHSETPEKSFDKTPQNSFDETPDQSFDETPKKSSLRGLQQQDQDNQPAQNSSHHFDWTAWMQFLHEHEPTDTSDLGLRPHWTSFSILHDLWHAYDDARGPMSAFNGTESESEEERAFYKAYRANPHYEATRIAQVRDALGTCIDPTCKIGAVVPPILEDRSSFGNVWQLSKLGRWQNASDGVDYGGKSLQCSDGAVRYLHQNGSFTINSIDAPIARWGTPSPYPTPFIGDPSTAAGVAFLLSDNAWDTNFILFFPYDKPSVGTNLKFRFQIEISG